MVTIVTRPDWTGIMTAIGTVAVAVVAVGVALCRMARERAPPQRGGSTATARSARSRRASPGRRDLPGTGTGLRLMRDTIRG